MTIWLLIAPFGVADGTEARIAIHIPRIVVQIHAPGTRLGRVAPITAYGRTPLERIIPPNILPISLSLAVAVFSFWPLKNLRVCARRIKMRK